MGCLEEGEKGGQKFYNSISIKENYIGLGKKQQQKKRIFYASMKT